MSKEALTLALEALQRIDLWLKAWEQVGLVGVELEAIKALEEALAKQEQGEPVAWMDIDEKGAAFGLRYWSEPNNRHEVPLYIKPQPAQKPWVGLTDEEIFETHKQVDSMQYLTFGKAIEAKLKEKNT